MKQHSYNVFQCGNSVVEKLGNNITIHPQKTSRIDYLPKKTEEDHYTLSEVISNIILSKETFNLNFKLQAEFMCTVSVHHCDHYIDYSSVKMTLL